MTFCKNRFDAFVWLVVLQVLAFAMSVEGKLPEDKSGKIIDNNNSQTDVKDVSTLPRVFYLNGTWLAENKVQIQKGSKTLLPAFKQLLIEADEAMKAGPFSVMDKTSIPPSGDKHDYMSQGKYWWPNPKTANGLPYVRKDGYVNPESRTGAYDYNRLSSMRDSVETLALAYYFSDEEKYAEHAADLLRIWFIDPKTRMNPNLNFGQGVPGRVKGRGIGIIDTAKLISIIDSIGLLESSCHWSRKDQSAMQAWMEEYLNWLRSSPNGRDEAAARNNHGTWYDAQVVCFAMFIDKPSIAKEVLTKITKSRVDSQIKPDGRQPYELERTKSLGYSQMNLRGFFVLARFGEHISVDLWNYRSVNGAGLRKAMDFLAGYIDEPSSWPYKQIKEVDRESIFDLLKWAQAKYDDNIYGQWIEKLPKEDITTKRENLFFTTNKKVQLSDAMQPEQIKTVMTAVADWQLNNPDKRENQKDTGWVHAVMFTGMTAWSLLSDDVKYCDVLKNIGEKNQWQMGPRIYHADDHCIGQMYLELYNKYKSPEMIASLRERFDYILANPSESQLAYKQGIKDKDRWWWCDALFMAPPVWTRLSAVTGDNRYIDFMNSEFKVTTDYLYDKKEHLYYRDSRYFTMRENNGKKIFWGRGNGWVIAGLARVLQHMPADYPDRQMYVRIYKEMADKLVSIQLPDGMWRASLLDPNSYPEPEASGSSLFCYAIAWGINQGILDEQKYLPVVTKAWDSLVKCVHPDGKLGNVQPIGFDPKEVTTDTTDLYGVGAFLLAGTEMYKISLWKGTESIALSVTNPSGDFCENKTIELEWSKLKAKLPSLTPQNVAVMSGYTGKLLLSQTVNADANGSVDQLLFQDDFGPQQEKRYRVLVIPQGVELPKAENLAHSMFVPQRYDDFAWENDRIAFRMYGPALQNTTGKDKLTSSGIDVWVKSVRYPIIEKWYKSGDYHKDHGEGLDYYNVGNSRGCGGIGIWKNDKLYPSENYSSWKIIANGPIRTIFELTFNPWDIAGVKVSEVKRISLDLGSNLNRVESQFKVDGNQQLQAAIGIVLRDVKEKGVCSTGDSWIGYWEPPIEGKGTIGCGIVINQKVGKEFRFFDGHYGAIVNLPADKKLVYYTGACWDKSGDFAKQDDWAKYLNTFAKNLVHPIILKIEK